MSTNPDVIAQVEENIETWEGKTCDCQTAAQHATIHRASHALLAALKDIRLTISYYCCEDDDGPASNLLDTIDGAAHTIIKAAEKTS